jgi:hypothetical protein
LATHRDDRTAGALELVYIEQGLECDVLEVEAISFVVVGTVIALASALHDIKEDVQERMTVANHLRTLSDPNF